MDDAVVSTFNFFDLFARLVPGMVFVILCAASFGRDLLAAENQSGIALAVFLALSCAAGAVLRCPAHGLRRLVQRRAFGGNPRQLFAGPRLGRVDVIKEAGIRRLAKKYVREICDREIGGGRDAGFAFGWMVSYLEIRGCSGKEDRIASLTDMCTSLSAAVLAIFRVSEYLKCMNG